MLKKLAATLAVLAPVTVSAQTLSAQTLTIGAAAPVTTIDPHFHNMGPNNALSMHIFDKLVERDGQSRLHPALATSWRAISDTEWEFKLRQGVTWHDGRPFTADDIAFSFARIPDVPNSPGGFGGFLRLVERIEVPDPQTLRVHTRQPNPQLPLDLASVIIVSRHAGEGMGTEDYNSGRAAIGTGPYRLVSFRPGDRVEMVRNDAYWAGPQPWTRVNYRMVLNDAARTAALLAGDVDLIEQIPSSDVARLRRDPRLQVTEVASLRTVYMAPNFSREGATPLVTDNAGVPLPANPFRDIRVRRALSMAINRDALVERVMEGGAVASGQWLPEGAFGYNPAIRPQRFDAEGAKRLLAEAGFPDGFRLTLHTPNDRWPNDSRIAQGVAQMWTRIGVRVQLEALPFSAFVPRRARQEFAMQLGAWGSSTGEASNFMINIVSSYDRAKLTGANNAGRYSNPAVDALTARASVEMDDARREALWHEAVALVDQEVPTLQLFQLNNAWALRRGLVHEPRMDERTVAMGVRPAP
ncbi:ABC transporter substrate-binding protein [Roseococcus sp.]|uniref:ABC transporter substrate-binding protein n=1 Tax=Roseococcus sp. TaxID=2109646 RepID=UPI003BAA64DB